MAEKLGGPMEELQDERLLSGVIGTITLISPCLVISIHAIAFAYFLQRFQ
jgi:hypothetical protein